MTEVLSRPSPSAWFVDWTCGGCNAVLRSTGDDVRVGEFGAMGDYDKMFYVDCPECGKCKTWPLYGNVLPGYVQHAARAKQRGRS